MLLMLASRALPEQQRGRAMGAVGGSMMPIHNMPAPLQAAAHYTINFWAIDGYTRLVYSGEGLSDIMGNIVRLLIIGAVTITVAQALLVRRFREVS